jgi:AraC-like DNA-binding protein
VDPHHDTGPVAESVQHVPAPALRPYLGYYSGYRQAGLSPARHRGLPSPHLTVIVAFDGPLTLAAHPDPRQPPGCYDTMIGGLHTSPAVVTHEGRQAGIQIGLSPLGARALLGLPAGEIANLDLDATEVLGSCAVEIHERVGHATTWGERFAVIDDVLLCRLRPELAVGAELSYAWQRLAGAGGAVRMQTLAEEVGWSTRHLASRFRTEFGLSPKVAARVMRFDRARRRLQARATVPPLTLADLAAESGYYDQAHLAREFRALAGCPPSIWRAEDEEFRNVQARPAMRLQA